jgi:UPF0176 protein
MAKKILPPYRVLLYYKYVKIDNPEKFTELHLRFCKAAGLKGRIIVASEGINGTVSGTYEQTEAYIYAMRQDPRFENMDFKIDNVQENAFKKMFVRHRSELVTLNIEDDIDPNEITGKHISPKEFLRNIEEEEVLIVDARNDYEYDLGHFKNAIRPEGIKNFKQFPQWIKDNLSEYKDKKILAYCTGGIRCEKFTGLLLKEGFKDVSQLEGGIVSYSKDKTALGKHFEGKCYVFDERISIPVNQVEEYVPVGKCYHCGNPTDIYHNCANKDCNVQILFCEECDKKWERTCSEECKSIVKEEVELPIQ